MDATLTVPINEQLAQRLRARAQHEGVSMEEEARRILARALSATWTTFWQNVDDVRASLSGRSFGDSVDLVREDRER